jgi:membrane-associated protein
MSFIKLAIDIVLHLDRYLGQIISTYGIVTYGLLFVVIFIETGLVVTPFLPGDSLLFAAGAFAALGSLNIYLLLIILAAAAILGDTANYWIGHFFGEKMIENPKIPIKKEHIDKTQAFFAKHGGKTIIMARFVPIVRTFAPFVAGIGKMSYGQFISYNFIGGIAWVLVATLAGYFFGNISWVKNNFSAVILAIALISILPMVIPLISNKSKHDKNLAKD